MRTLELSVRSHFAAVLALPDHEGICRHPHGYRFLLEVTVVEELNGEGAWSLDLLELESEVRRRVVEPLEGRDLRELLARPSLEGLLIWIVDRLATLPGRLVGVALEAPPRYRVAWRAAPREVES